MKFKPLKQVASDEWGIRWYLGVVMCQFATLDAKRHGVPYTEIHFYTIPETGEKVITYWDVSDDTQS